jgi:acyl carrier protein
MSNQSTKEIQEILENILAKIAPEADLANLAENENLRERLGIDSFDFLNFMIAINEALGVEIPEADYGKLLSLKDLLSYIESRAK